MSVGSCMGRNFIPNLNVDRCMVPGEYCSALPWQAKICCEGLYCEGTLGTDNYCAAVEGCKYGGQSCGLGGACCYPNRCTALYQGICHILYVSHMHLLYHKLYQMYLHSS
uniref:Uncharacterized protein n=1 Tax=Cannabis sativa TaxID=3483 RepID=A0A803Q8U8_CANSA